MLFRKLALPRMVSARRMCIHPRVVYENLDNAFDAVSRQRKWRGIVPSRPEGMVWLGPAVDSDSEALCRSPERQPMRRVAFADGTTGQFELPPTPRQRLQRLDERVARRTWPSAGTTLAEVASAVQECALDASRVKGGIERSPAKADWQAQLDPCREEVAVWAECLHRWGIAMIKGLPSGELVSLLSGLFGSVRGSMYGESFTIKAVSNPNNLAYSNDGLQMHTDLPFYSSPPHTQFFHCRQPADVGGETVVHDSFAAAERLWREDQQAFYVLASHPVLFFDSTPQWHLEAMHPTITLRPGTSRHGNEATMPDIAMVCFNQRTRDSWRQYECDQASDADLDAFYSAMNKFEAIIEDESTHIDFTLKAGEVIVTDNLRVLHSRRGFTGERHYEGAYVDWDAIKAVWRRSSRSAPPHTAS